MCGFTKKTKTSRKKILFLSNEDFSPKPGVSQATDGIVNNQGKLFMEDIQAKYLGRYFLKVVSLVSR
jgi:hypothetical protein